MSGSSEDPMLPVSGASGTMRRTLGLTLHPQGKGKLIVLCLAMTVAVGYLILAVAAAADRPASPPILAIAARNSKGEAGLTSPPKLQLATATSITTPTALATITPQPTATPASTATPQPTATPIIIPTATPIQPPTPQPTATSSTGIHFGTLSGAGLLAIIGIVLLLALVVMMIILLARRNGPPPGGPGAGTPPPTAAPPVGAPPSPPLEQPSQPNAYRQVEWGQVREAQWSPPAASGLPPIPAPPPNPAEPPIPGQTEGPTWTGGSSEATQPGPIESEKDNTVPGTSNDHI